MSTGGQVVGGVVGAVAGFFIGGPTGALYGAQIGIMAGGYLDPPKGPTVTGPRLNDLTVQTSTYGAVIPRVYGTVTVNGNVMWLQGNALTETVTKKKSGGKGGGSKTTTKTFSYSATFAVGLCEGPIVGVRRIWVGPDLIYDAGSADPDTIAASNAATDGFAIYLGTNTQSADPRIQADVGVANAPAWRGLAYIVFYDFPLARYSNSLLGAQVRVEVICHGSETPVIEYGNTPSFGGQYQLSPAFASWGGIAISKYPYPTDRRLKTTDGLVWVATTFPVSRDWKLTAGHADTILAIGSASFTSYTVRSTDGITWAENATLTYRGWSVIGHNGSLWFAAGNDGTATSGDDGLNWNNLPQPGMLAPTAAVVHSGRILLFNEGSSTYYTSDNNGASWTTRTYSLGASTGIRCAASNGVIIVGVVKDTQNYVISADSGNTWGTPAAFYAGVSDWTSIGFGNGWFYAHSDSHYVLSSDGTSWNHYTATIGSTHYSSDTMAWTGSRFSTVPTNSGTVCFAVTPSVMVGSDDILGAIVAAECLQSGVLTAGDIDVTALTSQVRGYRIGSIGALRAAIEPLQAAWPFDVRQHGYKVQFVARGGASVVTIPAADLDARAGGAAPGVQITTSREMDSQLARRVTVQHLDYDREYDAGSQYAERLNTAAVNALVLDLPIVMTSGEAAGVAEVLLGVYWLERTDVSFSLPPTYNQLEPGDVVTLTTPEGAISLRLTGVTNTSDGRVECTAKYARAAVYTPAALGEPSAVTGTSTILRIGPAVYVLLDVPMLTSAQSGPSFLAAMTGMYDGWRGGVLMRTRDAGATWDSLQEFERPGSAIGTCTNSLGVVESSMMDMASALSVTLTQGDLFSVTQLALFGGANHFAYGADGRWEIIAAQTCTLISGKSYVLRDLLRGRFGTEWAMGLHAVGDSLVLLDTTDVALIAADSSAIGLTYQYRGITVDRDISTDTDRNFTYRGVNLKPLSPVYLNGNRDGANDWSLSWVRRTRESGEWKDSVDVPLGEATEAYEIDVFADGTYAVVKRTIAASTPACAYSSANQVTDFGSNQSTLYLKIYQLSAVVGRGYPLTTSITR
jgi:hypothetical protein